MDATDLTATGSTSPGAVPPTPHRIGLVGGIGPASTRLYYQLLMEQSHATYGTRPEVVIHSLAFDRFTWLEDHDRAGYVREIRGSLQLLADAGAGVLAMSANSPHAVIDEVRGATDLPLISIVDSVVRGARAAGVESGLLLGIPVTMRGSFYAHAFRHAGLALEVPDERHHARIRSIVFDELTRGIRSPDSRRWLVGLLEEHGVDSLVLGCTELPDLIGSEDVPIPLLDSARLHVADILGAAFTRDDTTQ